MAQQLSCNSSPKQQYLMSLREFLSILLGYKKPELVPVRVQPQQKKLPKK
ncbi:hypothetical protein [Pseudocnuella soli]|nr:hypothetical protein [Pseudocnuella soli]